MYLVCKESAGRGWIVYHQTEGAAFSSKSETIAKDFAYALNHASEAQRELCRCNAELIPQAAREVH